PDYPAERTDSPSGVGAESGSRPRLRRRGLHPRAESHSDSARPRHRDGDRPRGEFDLIITALDPHATDWLGHADWDTLLTPRGLIAVVTHSDVRDGRLRDPHSVLLKTTGRRGLRCLDHIAVLTAPVPDTPERPAATDRTGTAAPVPDVSARSVGATAPPLRSVHHDLVLLGRLSSADVEECTVGGTETSDV
ncbi:MAG TPA: hypothetical protein VG674_00005, partial [Amycolatopsis sp.]|nr:hypothetical protein [Amycolatopsis sp.]